MRRLGNTPQAVAGRPYEVASYQYRLEGRIDGQGMELA